MDITATINGLAHDLTVVGRIGIGDKVSVCDNHLDIHKEGML